MARLIAYILAAAALAAALVAFHLRSVNSAKEQGLAQGRAEVQAQWAAEKQAQLEAANAAMQGNQNHQQEQINAVNEAQQERIKAEQVAKAAINSLSAERDRLRVNLTAALNTIRSCGAMPPTTADAASERAAAIEAVFADMERTGAEMARAADAHAADSLMLQQAWPK
jgi:hypothetical protein